MSAAQVRGDAIEKAKRGFAFSLLSNIGMLVLGMGNGLVTAHILGVEGRGQLAAIQNPVLFMSYVVLMGIPTAVAYYAARSPQEARSVFFTGWLLTTALAVPLLGLTWLGLPLAMKGEAARFVPAARAFLPFALIQVVMLVGISTLQGIGGFGTYALIRLLPAPLSITATLLAYGLGRPFPSLITQLVMMFSLVVSGATVFGLARASSGRWRFQRERVRPFLSYGLPTALLVPVGSLNLQLDQLVMANMVPNAALGLYAVSASWSSLSSPALLAVATVILPNLASTDDPATQKAFAVRSFRLAVLLGLILLLGHLLATPIVLPLLYGRSFAPAVPTAMVLACAGIPLSLVQVTGDILRGLGRPRGPLVAQLAALPITVGLLYVTLPRLGIMGGAVTSLLAYTTCLTISLVFIAKALEIPATELVPGPADLRDLVNQLKPLLRRLPGLRSR